MMEKLLSVSVAAYNVAQTLRETLAPFACCPAKEGLDVIIVDDGSSDDTARIAQEYVDMYPSVFRLIRQENGGWGATVNTGLYYARGKYFRQVDGDDHYCAENLPAYLEKLAQSDADLVITPYLSYDAQSGDILERISCNPGCDTGRKYSLAEIPPFTPFMHSLAARTECVRALRVSEHCFYTDTEYVLKACNAALTVMFLDMDIYCYRRAAQGQSMSLSGLQKHYREQETVIRVLLNTRQSAVKRPEIAAIYDRLLFDTCCWQYLVLLYLPLSGRHKRDLMAYDALLRHQAPDYYARVPFRTLKLLRRTHFCGYALAALYQKKRDNRFTKDGRLRT